MRYLLPTKRLAFVLVATTFYWLSLSPANADIYVAPDGRDTNPGTKSKPFSTWDRAQTEVRKLLGSSPRPKGGITVSIRKGDYFRTNEFLLTQDDSGTAECPVTWRAMPGEQVRLTGALKPSDFTAVSDPAILSRLAEPARGKVLQVSLNSLPTGSIADMNSRGFGRPSVPAHNELFADGKPMTLARWPNGSGFEKIAGFPESGTEGDGHGGKLGKLENGFYFAGDRPAKWADVQNAWVHGYWAWDWANSYERIERLDTNAHLLVTAAPHGLYGFRKGQRFYYLNVLEELDEPGEWYLDHKSRILYFWPPGPGQPDEVLLSICGEPLVRMRQASCITLQGFILEGTRATAVQIEGGRSNQVLSCLVRNIGNWGVSIQKGTGHSVVACDVVDTGDGGVRMAGGDRKTLEPGAHSVENCSFARQGRWSKCYVPAILMEGVGLRASHNLIREHPHCAILFGGNDHLIDWNEIHHIALETGDVGAIYSGRDYTYRGNRIRHNFIHETGGVGMGSMGVYMDDCVSGTEIFGNVFYKVQRAAFLGGGRDHHVINNIFVDCNYAVELDGRGLDKSPVWHDMVDKTMRNGLKAVPLELYRAKYPAMKTLDACYGPPGEMSVTGESFKGVAPENNVVARNVCVGKWLNVYWHATSPMLHLDGNLTNAASAFVRTPGPTPRARDFELKPEALSKSHGFEPIPFDKIGLVNNSMRKQIPAVRP